MELPMNCILYAQLPKGKQITDIDPEYHRKMRHYARMRGWDIIEFISDEHVDVDCVEKANLKRLRRCIKECKGLDVIIAAVSPSVTTANYAALKMISKEGIHLVIWASSRNRPTKPAT